MNRPYRVLHVFNWFNQGGIENFVMNVYRNIDRNKIQFDFAFLDARKGYFDEEAISLGAHIYHYDNEENTLKNHYDSLVRIINENGPYIAIHSHIYFFSGYILQIAKECGIPVRISHSHETKKGRKETVIRKLYENFMRFMIKKNATNMLSCSNDAGIALFGSNSPYQVLYNGIDLERFTFNESKRYQYRKQLNIEDKFVVLNVGRFADQKNHAFIVDIFENIEKKMKNAVLLLIGTGPLLDGIKEKLVSKKLIDKVIFLSNIMNTEDYYNTADVFILPSKYEGMGIVTIEAQATGLYSILSTNVTREVEQTDIVEYLDIDDPIIWADRIIEISKMKYERSNYNQIFVNSLFDIHRTVTDLQNVYMSRIFEEIGKNIGKK